MIPNRSGTQAPNDRPFRRWWTNPGPLA
jgi:hypothetical protein